MRRCEDHSGVGCRLVARFVELEDFVFQAIKLHAVELAHIIGLLYERLVFQFEFAHLRA